MSNFQVSGLALVVLAVFVLAVAKRRRSVERELRAEVASPTVPRFKYRQGFETFDPQIQTAAIARRSKTDRSTRKAHSTAADRASKDAAKRAEAAEQAIEAAAQRQRDDDAERARRTMRRAK